MKRWYSSRAIWTNIAMAVAMLVPIASTQLVDVVGVDMALKVGAGLGLLNAVLQVVIRVFVTDSAIGKTVV
jgi:ActR/RegA family two-component response regulator